jgi:hypothetical protein
MEKELQSKPIVTNNRLLVKQAKQSANLLLVNVYCISAIRFYQTVTKLNA